MSQSSCGLILLLCALFATVMPCAAKTPKEEQSKEIIVCVGDSITDGQSYSLLVQQALSEAGKPVPPFVPAGIGGDTSKGILGRLDRDVMPFKPTMVMLSTGINDVAMGISYDDYEKNMTQIIEYLQSKNVKVMLFTSSIIRGETADVVYGQYTKTNEIVHTLGAKYGCPVAEVNKVMRTEPKDTILWEDMAHLNFEGYRYMSRAILDAMGYPDVPVPTEFHLKPNPGIITHWRIRPAAKGETQYDDKTVAALKIDDTWKAYTLPETDRFTGPGSWWNNQEQARGFAMQLYKAFGDAPRYYSYAEVNCRKARKVYVNTGGDLGVVWLNGVRVFNNEYTTGWHAGGHRVPVTLKKGKNTILLCSGSHFFFSITDELIFDYWQK